MHSPEFSELLTHLSRAVNNVVMKAFEQGVSDGRGATRGTAHRSTQKQAKGRGSSSHTLPAARHANENSDSGDDADAGGRCHMGSGLLP